MLRRDRMLVLSAMLIGVAWCGLAPAQESAPSGGADREIQIRDRYEQVLATDPMRDPAFDRTYDAYLALDGIEAWVEKLQAPAATEEEARARLVLLGRIASRRFRSRDAVTHLEEAREQGMTGPRFQVLLGKEYARVGRDDDAIAELTAAVEALTDPAERAEVCRALGSLLLGRGREAEAIATWERIAEGEGADALALADLAEIYEDDRRWEEAIGAYRRMLDASAGDPYRACRALRAIGRCQEQLEQMPEAVATYEQALSLAAPGNWMYEDLKRRLVAAYDRMGDLDGLSRYLEARIASAPADLDTRELLADTYRRLGRIEEAEAAYREALARDPKRIATYERLIALYASQGRTGDEAAAYEELIAAHPSDLDYVRRLGEAHLRAGDAVSAKAAWERITLPQATPERLALLATWLERYEFPDEAIAAYEQALQMRPDREWVLRLAGLKHQRGVTEEARVLWLSAAGAEATAEEVAEIAAILSGHDLTADATALWRRAVALAPTSDAYRLSLARSLAEDEAYEEATALFEALAREAQTDLHRGQAEQGLIDAYAEMGVLEAKQAEWEAAAAASPEDVDLQMRLARLYDRGGDMYRGLAVVEACATIRPDDPLLLRELARRYRRARRIDQSIAAYTRLIETDRTRALAYLRELLQVYRDAGDSKGAVATAQRLVEQNPTNPEARALLAQTYEQAREQEAAAAEYRAAVRLDPTEPAYLRGYAQALLSAGQWGEAGDAARRMLEAATARETRLEAISILTQVHQRQGALDALLRELEERVRTTPADFAAYEELAAAYRYAGQPARALEVMSGALDQVDNRQEALRTLIRESFDALAFDKVLGFYEELLAIAGSLTPEEYERIGRVYAQLGHPDRALEIWNRIVEEDPGNPRAYERLARILASEGRLEASLTARERALELDPYNHAMRYELAMSLAGVEQTDRAMAQVEMILELGPSPEELAAEEAGAAPLVSGLPPGMVSSGSRPLPGAMMMPPAGAPYADYRSAAIWLLLNLAKATDGAEDVIARFREKAEQEPDNIQAQLDLMHVCGQPEEALDIGLALLDRVPDDLSLARRVMELLFDQQRTDEALALAEKLAERFPEQRRDLRLSLYHRLGRMNRPEEARALLEELVAEYPDDRSFVQIAIHARASEGDADGAMALAESFMAAHPDEAETVRRMAAKALEDAAPERAMDLYEALLFDTELPPVGQFRGRAPSQGVYIVARLGDAGPRSSVSNLLMSMPTVAEAVRISSPQASACEALTGPDAPPERRAAALARIEAEAGKLAEAETTEAYDRALAFCALRALVHLGDGEIAEARRWLAPFLSDARPTLEAANLELYLLDVEGRYEDMAQRYAALRRAFPGLEQSLLPAEASAWRLAQNGDAAAEAIIASLAGISAPGVFLEQIRTLSHLGRASDARRLLEGFLSETNRNPDALALLAGMYHKEGDTRRAIELVREAYLAQAQRGGMQGWGASGYAGPGMGFGTMTGLGSVVWPTGLSSRAPLPGFHPGPAGRGATRQPSELLRLWHRFAKELNETGGMVAEFEERLRQQPNAIQAHVEMAHVYRLEERYEDVIAVYRRLIERQPTYHAARQALATLLVERNRITDAIEVYEQLMQVHPAGRRMYRSPLRELYRRVGEETRVEELDRDAMQRATTPQEALTLAQEFRATGDLAQAEELYRRALRMDPTQPHVHRELAQVLRQEGKLEEALEVNRAYLANPSFSPGAGFDLSAVGEMVSLSRELGRLAELTAEQEAALAADPENGQAKYFLACIAQDAGDLSRALSLLRELDTDGRFAHAIVNVLEMSGDTAGLYAYLKEQAEAPGRGYADYRRLARCAMALGDRAGAVHWIEENARQQGGGRPEPRYVLDELVSVGLFDEAERFYLEQRPTAARDANRLENFDRIALRGWSEYGRFDAALRTVLSSGEHGPVDPLIERLCMSGGSGARRAEMLAFLLERHADRLDVLKGMYQWALNANDEVTAIALLKRLLDAEPENEEYIGRYTDLLNRNAAERELIAWYEARAEADWTVGSVSRLARHLKEKGYVKRYEALKARAIETAPEEERDRFAQAFADIEAPPAPPQVAPYQIMPGMPVALAPEALAQLPPGTTGSPIEVMKAAIRANPSAAMLEQFMMQLASFQQDRVAYELFKEFRDEPFMADWKVTNDQWLHVLLRFGDDADRRMVYEHVYTTAMAPQGDPMFAMGAPPGVARLYLIPQYLPPNHHAGFAAFLDAKLAELEGPSREQCMLFAQLYGAVQAHDRVLELTDRVIADGWRHAEVIRMRASALGSLGRHDEQIAALDGLRARASAGERGGIALEIARAMIAAGRPGEADAVVAAAVTEDRSPNLALTAGQYFLDERKNPEAALPLLERACAEPDRAESAAHPLARCYAELGRTSDAAAVAERYPRLIGYGPDLSKLLVEHGDVDAAERLLSLATDANQMQSEAFRAVFGAMLEQGAFDRAVQLGERVAAMQRSEHHRRQTTRSAAGALLDTGTIGAWLESLSDAPGAFAVHTAARLMEEYGRRLERPAALTELVRAHVDVLVQEQEGAARFAESVRETAPDLALAVVRALLAQPYIRQSATNAIWTTVLNADAAEGVELTLTALDRTPSRVASSWDAVRFVAEHGTDEQVARLREIYAEFYPHAGQLSLFDGHVLFMRGDYEAGLDAIEAGCAGPDVTASELRQAAELLDAEGRIDAADAAYARVCKAETARNVYGLSADVHGARLARLRLAWRRGDAERVRALFAEAAAEAPGGEADDVTVMMTAQALGNLGLRDEALRLVDERFTGRAGAMALMQTQGLGFLGHLGGPGLAEQALRRILENAPDSQHLLGASQMLPGASSSEFALEAFRRAGAAPPWHMAHLTQMMGQRFIEAGLPEEAIALYAEQLRVADPMRGGPTPSVQERVAAYAAAGRIDGLLAEADATLEERPGDLNALLTRAHALIQTRRIAEGVESAAKAMENGASPTSTREFAVAALHLEDPGAVADRLAALLANAETTDSTDADAVARLRLAAGDVEGAVALMRPLASEAKWTGSARQGLERLAALDRWEEAAAWYATARRAMAETGSDAYELDRLVLRAIEDGRLGPETFRAVLQKEATAPNTGASLRAVKQHCQGDLEGAMEWIRPLLEAHPDAPGLHRIAAELHRDNGDPQSAVAHCERTIALDAAKPEDVRALVDLLMATGMEARALTFLRDRMGETPTREDVAYFAAQLARAHRAGELLALADRDWGHLRPSERQGLRLTLLETARPLTGPDLAMAAFQDARAAGGDEHLAARYLSHLWDTGRLDEAWQELEGGSCQLSLRMMTPGVAAQTYARHGRMDEAADIVLSALFVSTPYPMQYGWFGPHFGVPGYPSAFVAPMPYAMMGIPSAMGMPGGLAPLHAAMMPDIPGALEPFGVWSRRLARRVVAETSGVADRFQRRVHLALLAGDATMRLRAADEALAERPKWPAALETRAMALGELGRHEEAAETWRRLTGTRPLAMEGVREVAVARALFAAGLREEAQAELAAVRAWSHDASTRAQMGDLLLEYGEAAEAEAEYRLALRRDPTQVGAIAGLAGLCLSDGRVDEGMALWRRLPHDSAPSRATVAARLREQGHADAALPLFAALLGQRPGARQGLTDLLAAADAVGDGAWERVLDAVATAVGRTRGERRDDVQRTFGAWCARTGRIDALIAAVSAEGGAHAGLAASVAEAVRAAAEEGASTEGPGAEWLDAADALAIDTAAGLLALGDAATQMGDTDRAARRLQQAAVHGDATIGQRRAAAAGLLAAGRAREALAVFDTLLSAQPNLYMRDADALRAAALAEDAEALADRLDACRPYLANDAQAGWLRAHADWLGDRREAALAAWEPLLGVRDLTGEQLSVMADCFDEADRSELALEVHAQLAAGGYGNAQAAKSLARLIEAAAEAGDLQQAATLYARLAPLNARRAADVAGALVDATTAERLPELRAALAAVIQTDPANDRVSECAALYAHAARRHGEVITAAAFATELGASAFEVEEAAYWDGAFRNWRVTPAADAFDEAAVDTLRELLASDAAYVPDAKDVITLTPLPETMTAGAPTGPAFVAATTVYMEAAGRRTLEVLAPGPAAVRINGGPARAPARVFGGRFDAFLIEADFVAGENALLLTVQPVQAIPYFAAGFAPE